MAENYETAEAGVLWGLYYALYHAPLSFWQGDVPDAVIGAYMAAQEVRNTKNPVDRP